MKVFLSLALLAAVSAYTDEELALFHDAKIRVDGPIEVRPKIKVNYDLPSFEPPRLRVNYRDEQSPLGSAGFESEQAIMELIKQKIQAEALSKLGGGYSRRTPSRERSNSEKQEDEEKEKEEKSSKRRVTIKASVPQPQPRLPSFPLSLKSLFRQSLSAAQPSLAELDPEIQVYEVKKRLLELELQEAQRRATAAANRRAEEAARRAEEERKRREEE